MNVNDIEETYVTYDDNFILNLNENNINESVIEFYLNNETNFDVDLEKTLKDNYFIDDQLLNENLIPNQVFENGDTQKIHANEPKITMPIKNTTNLLSPNNTNNNFNLFDKTYNIYCSFKNYYIAIFCILLIILIFICLVYLVKKYKLKTKLQNFTTYRYSRNNPDILETHL